MTCPLSSFKRGGKRAGKGGWTRFACLGQADVHVSAEKRRAWAADTAFTDENRRVGRLKTAGEQGNRRAGLLGAGVSC